MLIASTDRSPPCAALARATVAFAVSLLAACAGRTPRAVRPTVPVPGAVGAVAAPVAVVTPEDLRYLRDRQLLVPVAGARTRALRSSFDDLRDGGERRHLALDIMAPRGTPVLAADDGRVWTVRQNTLGGLTVYAVDPDERFVFYYAHLDHYHPGLTDGMPLLKGDTLGYVGTTGNAPASVPHLHFQLSRLGADRRWWTGTPVDPTPFLHDAEVALTRVDVPNAVVVPAVRPRGIPFHRSRPAGRAAPVAADPR